MGARFSQEDFIKRVRSVHGNRFTYPDLYVRSHDKLRIQCPIHGDFYQVAKEHMAGAICPECAQMQRPLSKMYTQDEFFAKCKQKHNNKYRYPEPFTGVRSQLAVECPVHGLYHQLANNHLRGSGCQKCKGEYLGKLNTSDQAHFIARSRTAHGDKYTYPGVYLGAKKKITIECPEHGIFEQTADEHMNGYGCQKCGGYYTPTLGEFEVRARSVHGDRYKYPGPLNSMGSNTTLTCPDHGDFNQTPSNHLAGKGCRKCAQHYSKPHQAIEKLLGDRGLQVESSTRQVIKPLELDIYVPSLKLAIEYNGDFWHSVSEKNRSQKNKHRDKFLLCKEKGIKLLQIPENQWNNENTRAVWESMLGVHTGTIKRKVPARHTTFSTITREQAREFLEFNHLQGSTSLMSSCFGIWKDVELLGVVTFAWHNKFQLNLSRMAFLRNTSVVGGASKLFNNALAHLPSVDIVTFSNNMYSAGNLYPHLGFKHDADLPASYQWLYAKKVLEKRQCRHSSLGKLLGDLYDPNLSEHQNMFRAGARCLYDAGYQRWIYHR